PSCDVVERHTLSRPSVHVCTAPTHAPARMVTEARSWATRCSAAPSIDIDCPRARQPSTPSPASHLRPRDVQLLILNPAFRRSSVRIEVDAPLNDSRSIDPATDQTPPNGAGASNAAVVRGRCSHQRQPTVHISPPPVGLL